MEENQNIDTEALKKELEGFIAIAKSEKEKIEALAASIFTKSEEIELYHTNFVELRTKLSNNETGAQALLDKSTNIKNQIDQVNINAQEQYKQITEKINSINIKVQDMETYYGTFSDLRNKLGDANTGLQALLTQATSLKTQTEQANTSAQSSLKLLTEKATSITAKIQEIEQYYSTTFVPLKAKVDHPKDGIQATLGSATMLKDEIIKTKAGADENYREIKNLTDQSIKLREQSEASHKEIEELKKRSGEFKADIEQTFQIATDVSLANSFNERKKDLQIEADKWLKNVEYSTWFLAILVVGIFLSQYLGEQSLNDWRFWYRFVFTSPVIFYVAFASYNYNKVRDLLERYSFKFATSLSLQSYTKLLTDNFTDKEHKEKLLDFSIRAIETVYKEPYLEKDKSRKFNVGNKIVNIGLEDVETLAKQNIDIAEVIKDKK